MSPPQVTEVPVESDFEYDGDVGDDATVAELAVQHSAAAAAAAVAVSPDGTPR